MTRIVFVTGARGKTGSEVVKQLAGKADVDVRSGSAQPELLELGDNVRPVRFDWHDPGSWRPAVAGADAVYLMRPDLPNAADLVATLVGLNPASHIVLLSEQSAETLPDEHWARRVEDAVTAAARSWTVLRPSWFQQVLTDPRYYRDTIRESRILSLPSGGAPIGWVDTRDIAGVAVAALLEPGKHDGQRYTITGPEGATVAEIAELLTVELGEPVRSLDPPISDAIQGMDPWMTGMLDNLLRRLAHGEFGKTTDTVATVTGREPTSVRRFISEHHNTWRQAATR